METKQTAVDWLEEQLSPDMKTMQGNIIQGLFEQAKAQERQQLEAAFRAGWMRANATNYNPSYFEHFLSETYDNH